MARSDRVYSHTGSGRNPHVYGTAAYFAFRTSYWLRSAKWWKQWAWIHARKGDETRFAAGLKEYSFARERYTECFRKAREAGAKTVEPVLA